VAAPFVALTALLLIRGGPSLRRAGVGLGAVAAAGTVATAAAFSLAASASAETWVESTNEPAFVLFGLVVLAGG
jgi:hypothetical protein